MICYTFIYLYICSYIFTKDAVHSVLVMKSPMPWILTDMEISGLKEEYQKNMTKVESLKEVIKVSNEYFDNEIIHGWYSDGNHIDTNIARVQKCPGITTLNSLFGICLFCLLVFVSVFQFFLSFF